MPRLIEAERRVFGAEHEETIGTMGDLATTLSEERRLPEAEKLLRDVLKIQKRVLGREVRYTWFRWAIWQQRSFTRAERKTPRN